jgi:hypothetical protein
MLSATATNFRPIKTNNNRFNELNNSNTNSSTSPTSSSSTTSTTQTTINSMDILNQLLNMMLKTDENKRSSSKQLMDKIDQKPKFIFVIILIYSYNIYLLFILFQYKIDT